MAKLAARILPAQGWIPSLNPQTVRQDAFAGFSNAAIVIPQGVAFATLQDLAPAGRTRFVELALMITILFGLIQLAAGLARLGGLVSFVSHSVMTAFTATAAVLIGVSQISGSLCLSIESSGNVLERIHRVSIDLEGISGISAFIALTTLINLILFKTFAPKLPGFLLALIVGALVCLAFGGADRGIAMVGEIPAALPSFAPPAGAISDISALMPCAMAVALVGLLEAISIGRSFSPRRREKFDANQDMIGQGLSNAVGGFFQCYAGSRSFTRNGVNAEAGAKTPWAGILSSIFLTAVLVLFSDLIQLIPVPAMA